MSNGTTGQPLTAFAMLFLSVVATAIVLVIAWSSAFGYTLDGWQKLTTPDKISLLSLILSLVGSCSAFLLFASGAGRVNVMNALSPRYKICVIGGVLGLVSLSASVRSLLLNSLTWYYVWLVGYSLIFILWDCAIFFANKSGHPTDIGEINSRLGRWLWFTDFPCFLSSVSVLMVVAPFVQQYFPALQTIPQHFVRGLSTGVSLAQFIFVALFLFLGVYQDFHIDAGRQPPPLMRF